MAKNIARRARPSGRTLPTELAHALQNCNAALQSLGAAEARVSRQLADIQADRAVLTRRPFAPMTRHEPGPGV